MCNIATLKNLGNVLLLEADPAKAQFKVDVLTAGGSLVDVVEHDFQVLTRLGSPNHGYSLVFLGNRPMYPDAARQTVLEGMNLCE